MRIVNVETSCRKLVKTVGNFHILEYTHDASVSPTSAVNEYFMGKMNVRRRQVLIEIVKDHSAVIQAGAMQWMGGHVEATTGVKGIGDLFGKALKGAVTKESAVKPGIHRRRISWYWSRHTTYYSSIFHPGSRSV